MPEDETGMWEAKYFNRHTLIKRLARQPGTNSKGLISDNSFDVNVINRGALRDISRYI